MRFPNSWFVQAHVVQPNVSGTCARDHQNLSLHRRLLICTCSLKDMLYRKRMERELLRAKGLLKGPETAPGEEVCAGCVWRPWSNACMWRHRRM